MRKQKLDGQAENEDNENPPEWLIKKNERRRKTIAIVIGIMLYVGACCIASLSSILSNTELQLEPSKVNTVLIIMLVCYLPNIIVFRTCYRPRLHIFRYDFMLVLYLIIGGILSYVVSALILAGAMLTPIFGAYVWAVIIYGIFFSRNILKNYIHRNIMVKQPDQK